MQEVVSHAVQDLMDILFESSTNPNPGIVLRPTLSPKLMCLDIEKSKVDLDDQLMDYDDEEIEINKITSNYSLRIKNLIKKNYPIYINHVTIEDLKLKRDNFGKYVTIGIIDSGCPIHMTPFKNLFRPSTLKELQPCDIKIS